MITRSTADLRRSNQALDERRRYIETLVAQLGTAVLSVDREGSVTTANPAVESMLGLPVKPGDSLREALEAAGLEPLARFLDDAAALDGRDARRELVLDRGGASISVSVHVSRLRGVQGDNAGTLVMVEDLTDLLEAQRLAAWREVARRIAHEIKNPLTPIQLAAQRLRKKWDERAPDLGEVVLDATATIEREVTGLKSLVDEFSLYARMPAPAPARVDFGEIVRSVVRALRRAPGRGLGRPRRRRSGDGARRSGPDAPGAHQPDRQRGGRGQGRRDHRDRGASVVRAGLAAASRSPTAVPGSTPRIATRCSRPISPRSRAGRAWDSRSCSASSSSTTERSESRTMPGGGARFIIEIPGDGEPQETPADGLQAYRRTPWPVNRSWSSTTNREFARCSRRS